MRPYLATRRRFHLVLASMFPSNLLIDLRQLANNQTMRRILEDLHSATVANSRCYAVFGPMLQNYMNQHYGLK